jgi:hypothetical protein
MDAIGEQLIVNFGCGCPRSQLYRFQLQCRIQVNLSDVVFRPFNSLGLLDIFQYGIEVLVLFS